MSYVERETGLVFKSQVTYANPGSVGRDIFTCLSLLSQPDDQLPLLTQYLNLPKILAIAEEEGVRQVAYALKLLQSDGELKIASTGKDQASGELVTREFAFKGR